MTQPDSATTGKAGAATGKSGATAGKPGQGARNLVQRVLVALVLIPLALALAYAGGAAWTALVTVVAIGLYVEWLMVIGKVKAVSVTVSGAVALALSGVCLALGLVDFAVVVLGLGLVVVTVLAAGHRSWAAAGWKRPSPTTRTATSFRRRTRNMPAGWSSNRAQVATTSAAARAAAT